ncbi:sugar-binding domain-containing protein [Enterococcus devriesei]|uniref:Uncharacterized protein n=1 Tax=Enterococcus devriesei TaxID=319970 RepID=A0A1L8SV25_9ENTE|nr:sugar-binding domain-containing protein [Enterococcus devriesei]OJG35947.1 hypothetical protein RV00_GL002091 [Enterococcus devriesei]
MQKRRNLNQDWKFHYGEIGIPRKMAKKAHALGGLTAPVTEEAGYPVNYGLGGEHFLKLIAGGDTVQGLKNLAGTEFDASLDKNWQTVTIPHDWKISQPYVDDPMLLMSGSKAEGIGYYRKTFSLENTLIDHKRIIIHFEGVMRSADIWLNGAYVGSNNSGYVSFSFDVTEMVRYGNEGTNVLLVRSDTTTGPEGWWYEGGGIYKDVWLEIRPLTAINQDKAYIYTKEIHSEKASMGAEICIENSSEQVRTVLPEISIGSQAVVFDSQIMQPFEERTVTKEFEIVAPKLWSPESPYLYDAIFRIDTDECHKKFGVRTFAYDTSGFYLNGESYILQGVCEHQDFAGVGIALNQDIVDYKVKIMKDMGVNAWRSAHHFASEELLTACDKFGILLMNENRLLESTPWRLRDLEEMVIKSRMHASLVFWSVANEEVIGNTAQAGRIAKRLVRSIKRNNYESLVVSAELLNPKGIVDPEYLAIFDVLGVNYPEADVMGPGAVKIKENYPGVPLMSTESASYFSTRGIYQDDEKKCQCSNFGSMFSMVLPGKRQPGDPGVGGTAKPEKVMSYLNEHPYMGGVFLWTAFDYYGEPSPFGWPAISSAFGIADLCGFPKDYYYYYAASWRKEPMIHVLPHWNLEGLPIDSNGHVPVRVFSNTSEAELFINQKSYGKKPVNEHVVDWIVPYQAGKLEVIGYDHGQPVTQAYKETSSIIKSVVSEKIFDGEEYSLYRLKGIDAQQRLVHTADNRVTVAVENGMVIGLANGDPANYEEYSLKQVRLFQGQALLIIRSNGECNVQTEIQE